MAEILSVDQYPEIEWSREYIHEDGDPADTFGLILFRAGENGLRLNEYRQLIPYRYDNSVRSILGFGTPGNRKLNAIAEENRPFSLDDPDRINRICALSQELTKRVYQAATAGRILDLGERLLSELRTTTSWVAGQDEKRDAGIIEELVQAQKNNILPERLEDVSQQLQELGVIEVTEGTGYRALFPKSYLKKRVISE